MTNNATVDMTKGVYRRIYAGFLSGKRINSVSVQAEAWFWRLMMLADDMGNLSAEPNMIHNFASPVRRVTKSQASRYCGELYDAGLISHYTNGSDNFIHINDFLDLQPANKSGRRIKKVPTPDECGGIRGNPGESGGVVASHSHSHSQSKSKNQSPAGDACLSDFDSWWESYPHKVGKQAAKKAYTVARKVADHDTLLAGVAAYVRSKPHDRPYCNPVTWLNQGRWEDQPATPGASRPKSGVAALTDEERASLWAYVVTKEPDKHHMGPGWSDARPLMKKHFDAWRQTA